MRKLLSVYMSGLALVLCLGAGCITSREGQLPPITQWPLSGKPVKPSISLTVNGKVIQNGKEQDVMSTTRVQQWRTLIARAYQESELFSAVKEGISDTDLVAEINVLDRNDYSGVLAFITGFTYGLVPSSESHAFTLSTTLKNQQGLPISTINMRETRTTWVQLFLLFAMPFQSAENDLVYDLNRATIQEALGKGHL